MDWKDNFIKFVNKLSKKKGWKCDDMNPFFHRIIAIQSSKEKTIRQHKQKQKASK